MPFMKSCLVLFSCLCSLASLGQQDHRLIFISKKDSAKQVTAKLPLEVEIQTAQKTPPFFLIVSANDSTITALSLLQNDDTNALKRADYENRLKQLDSLEIRMRATDSLSKQEKEKRITTARMMLAYKDTVLIRVKDIRKITFNRNNYSKREEALAWVFTGTSVLVAFAGLGELLTIGSDSANTTVLLASGIPLFTLGVAGSIVSGIHLHRVYYNVIYMRKWNVHYHP